MKLIILKYSVKMRWECLEEVNKLDVFERSDDVLDEKFWWEHPEVNLKLEAYGILGASTRKWIKFEAYGIYDFLEEHKKILEINIHPHTEKHFFLLYYILRIWLLFKFIIMKINNDNGN